MARNENFHSVSHVGPVQIGTYRDHLGRTRHAAACTNDGCGWSSDYSSRAAASLAARTHRCRVR
ncbi:mobile element transfer protein [Streptomyces sp. DSM 41987]|uniref:mobile element transfer protein n=1 Tax=Streptomyces TaxID=1883 RepID=UPI0018DFFABC|nr:mobile element transfer protein [Streptomyces fildesensis]